MNKDELSNSLADKIGITKKQALDALDYLTETITSTIKDGGDVTLTGFGTFSARQRKGRIGVNPRNISEKIEIPSVLVAKFKAGKNLKEALKSSGSSSSESVSESTEEASPTEE
ncbi:HU family DNA-binding protein [Patescibacteria group bacterium]|nr:HU family DNA-binding protein [Patescibacteria group bacterium]